MGIADFFGFGKKEGKEKKENKDKTPFRVPREVMALRSRIETENRENFPNLARYQEIVREAAAVYRSLEEFIANREHADDAVRIRDDIRKKLDALGAKIKSNVNEGKDYVEKNIDYLERKSTRNTAKTLFTEFLEAYELFLSCCREGKPGEGTSLDSATDAMINALSALHSRFIKVYTKDQEIQGLKDMTIAKISELDQFCMLNAAVLEGQGLKPKAEASVKRLQNAAKKMSEN
jgi:hypothetical protein